MNKLFTLLTACACIISVHAQTFQLIEGSEILYAKGMSSDGKYIAGQVGHDQELKGHYSFVWTQEEGLKKLNPEDVNKYLEGNSALRISLTGRVVGIASDLTRMVDTYEPPLKLPLITAAYRDLGDEKWKILPLLEGIPGLFYGFGSKAFDITDDGTIIVGGQASGGQSGRLSAGYWDVSDPAHIVYHALLSDTRLGYSSAVKAVSGDGKVMGGYDEENSNVHTTLWINGEKSYVPGSGGGAIKAISHNGRYAVFQNEGNYRAALYDIEKRVLNKFDLNERIGVSGYSTPCAVSDNGIVVGYWGNNTLLGGEKRVAFIYAKTIGMLSLTDFLTNTGINFQGVTFLEATGISADGTIITGFGTKSGKAVSFRVEIPELPTGINPVPNVFIDSPAYGKAVLSWEAPETLENVAVTHYKIYTDDDVLLATVNVATHSYELNNLSDGTYHYSIRAVYDDDQEAVASKTVVVTMGKKTLPFFDDFSDYQPGGAIAEVMGYLEEIPLSTGYWDVSANTVPFRNSWRVYESGYPHWCAYFLTPSGDVYNESLVSPYFDASQFTDLALSFNVRIPVEAYGKLAVEMYDGAEWSLITELSAPKGGRYEFIKEDVSRFAGKDNIRVRFRAYGNGEQIRWYVDNVGLTDAVHEVAIEDALVIAARAVDGTVHVNWSDPTGHVDLRYMWDDNVYRGALTNDKLPFVAANMYPAEDLTAYEEYKLTSISFWRTTNPDGGEMTEPVFRWFVSQGGERLFSAPVTTSNFKWNTIELDEPIAIDGSKPLYYGVEVVDCDPQDWPIGSGTFYTLDEAGGMDIQIADGRGNIYSEDDGQTWLKLSDDGLEYDLFSIRATLAKDPAIQPKERIFGYQILRNGEKLLDQLLYGNDILVPLNNYTDLDPLPEGQEACYTVKIYYTYQVFSKGITTCITRTGGIDLKQMKSENGLKIYPNVIGQNETITVELSDTGKLNQATIRIYDISGQTVKEIPVTGTIIPVQLNVAAGVYILKVNDRDPVRLIVK